MEFLEKWITELARRQGGVVTRSQLLSSGLSSNQIQHRRGSGLIAPINKYSYRVLEPRDRLDLVRGAVVALPNAVVSHESAAALRQFPTAPSCRPTVTVHSRTTHLFPGVTVRRCTDLAASDVSSVHGVPTTLTERTLVDLAPLVSARFFDRMAQDLIIAKWLSMDRLVEVINRVARRGKPGSALLREWLDMRVNGAVVGQSELERVGRELLGDSDLPPFTSEYSIPWDEQKAFDDAAPKYRLAIEWDSRHWHASVESMEADRQRDREANAHGWMVLRFTWTDVTNRPETVVQQIKDVIARIESLNISTISLQSP